MAAVIKGSPATVATSPFQMPTVNFRSVVIKVGGSGSDVLYITTNGSTPSSTNHSYQLTAGQAVEIFSDQVRQSQDILVVSDSSSVVIYNIK